MTEWRFLGGAIFLYHYAALDLLAMHYKQLRIADIAALIAQVRNKAWWDTVGAMAGIIGDILHYRHDHMDAALGDGDLRLYAVPSGN